MQINGKYKIFLLLPLIVLWYLFKAFVTVVFAFLAGFDGVIVQVMADNFPIAGSKLLAWSYGNLYLWLAIAISIYMAVLTILGLNKKHYLILAACLIVFFAMCFSPIMQYSRLLDACLSNGHVWDGDLQQCRDDCLTWNEKDGCVPLYQKKG